MSGSLKTLRSALVLATTLLAVALSTRAASAQSFDPHETGWEGTKGLVDVARKELGDARVDVTEKLDWKSLAPSDGLLLLHPETVPDPDELAAFLRAGGRAAVLDDFGAGDRILARYGIHRIPAPRAPLFALRNNPSLALAEPVGETQAGRRGGVHPVVAEVTRLVTNHPTGLLHPNLATVLRIRASGEPDVALAVAGQVGAGRLFAMGDPSAVINLMLRYPGNRAFAAGLVRYLVDDDTGGARGGKLVIVANRFEEAGAFGESGTTSRELRDFVRNAKKEVQRVAGDGLPKAWALALAVMSATGLLLWIASSAARAYKHPIPRFARPTPLVAQGGAAGRAAVLSAPTTHRALVLLEQKDAFEEEAGEAFGMEKPTIDVLLDEIAKRRALSSDELAALRRTLLAIAKAETAVASGSPVRVSKQDLLRVERALRHASEKMRKAGNAEWLPR